MLSMSDRCSGSLDNAYVNCSEIKVKYFLSQYTILVPRAPNIEGDTK